MYGNILGFVTNGGSSYVFRFPVLSFENFDWNIFFPVVFIVQPWYQRFRYPQLPSDV